MDDYSIIKQIGVALKMELPLLNGVNNNEYYDDEFSGNGYSVNESGQVISVSLSKITVKDPAQILGYLKNLKHLRDLRITNCGITDITPLISLEKLENLDLSNNGLGNISALSYLSMLESLKIARNQIIDLTPLKGLQKLRELYAHENEIVDISSIGGLLQLTHLYLSDNEIVNISPLKALKEISFLTLHKNEIVDISSLKYLDKIQFLYLGGNKIQDFSSLRELVNLAHVDLNDSSIKDLTFLKGQLQLQELYLENNQIEDLTPLKELEKLREIDLSNNRIKHIPDWLIRLGRKIVWREIYEPGATNFFGNPIESPPIEIVKRGKAALLRYFDQIRNQGIDYIYEAKLTLVGEGSAGKTSLQTRLMDANAPLPGADFRTRGIKINDWEFKKDANNRHIVHIWDFGGQDVYYPVHRFFLTENSIFVLLASTRQTHHKFDYWIPTIYQFGGKSPIILGQTCDQGNRVLWNDLGYYVGNAHFNIIKTQELPYQEINLLKKNEGLSKIKKTIIDQIKNMPHYGKGVPKPWVFLRTRLVRESGKESCISFERFSQLCKRSSPTGFPNLVDIQDCAKFLHSIGVILWYSDNEELSNWVVLQPEWAMNAVYKIIDDDDIQKRRGNILAKDFIRLWKDKCYEGKHGMLKKMLEVFKIAFPKKHTKGDYILPARLVSIPSALKWPDKEPYLRLEYKFEFMPRGMVNQVSAELSRYIVSDKEVWNNAVNLSNESKTAECQIEEDFYNRRISIKAKGKDARGLIMIVMNALKDITEDYRGVELEIIVPCTCSVCMSSPKPEVFSYEKLLKWSEGKDSITCNESGDSLSIDELLYNIGLPNPEKEKRRMGLNKVIRLFLASSSELEDDRREFEIFISRENALLDKKGIFIELNIWENFIDAMSSTRLQEEYNQVIEDCDIFLSLFFTKVGKYTAEEFERAFDQFKKTGKPFIYTYFKDGTVNISKIKKPDIDSKLALEEKLKSLGHFPTTYQDINDLKYQFKMQLEKILPKL